MQNFRVLSKDREDRAILEVAPTGKGGRGLADSVKPDKGEDIFDAVEKACLSVPGTTKAVADLEKKCVPVPGTADVERKNGFSGIL